MCSYWLSGGWAGGRGCAAESERPDQTTAVALALTAEDLSQAVGRIYERVGKTHPYDDADSRHTGGGHDFGTVGDEVEQDRNDGLRSMVEFIPQHWWEVATRIYRRIHNKREL